MQLLQHIYVAVSSVTELSEQMKWLEEATKSLASQQLQVQALAQQEIKIKQQKKQLQARQQQQQQQVIAVHHIELCRWG